MHWWQRTVRQWRRKRKRSGLKKYLEASKKLWKDRNKVLEETAQTQLKIEYSIEKISNVEKKCDYFTNEFKNVLDKLCKKIANSLSGKTRLEFIKEEDVSDYSPVKMDSQETKKQLYWKKHIMILTRSRLSAANGILTFRGDNGIYTK